MNTINSISIAGLFGKYRLHWNLHPDVNILVGVNGSGKTTILRCVDALLSGNFTWLKQRSIEISISLADGSTFTYNGKPIPMPEIRHEYVTTFDVPLRKMPSRDETPLDKELQRVLYALGNNQKSFSGYRLKATNSYAEATTVNNRIKKLFALIDELCAETDKTVEIDRDSSMLYFRQAGERIPISRLSSGEKQLMVILFTVFLMEDQPYMMLTDEPEISLHIGWQQRFIDVLKALNPKLQLLVATHSPSIFGEGWGDKLFFTEELISPL
ncbi:MAG: ATP-binding protein [Tannerellaceae bacterium]|jgi:predicted ATP-binding protein involved in virulence|nr:ATP-binding protein [Tannerellaceae bacterium]